MQDSLNRFLTSKIYKKFLVQKQLSSLGKSKSKSGTMSSKSKSFIERNTLNLPNVASNAALNGESSPIIRNASSFDKIQQQYGLIDD